MNFLLSSSLREYEERALEIQLMHGIMPRMNKQAISRKRELKVDNLSTPERQGLQGTPRYYARAAPIAIIGHSGITRLMRNNNLLGTRQFVSRTVYIGMDYRENMLQNASKGASRP